MNKPVSIFAGLILLIYCSCSSKKEDPVDPGGGGGGGGINCNGANVSFSATVQPIIQASCQLSGCHDGASTNGPGPLTSYDKIKSASARIRAAVISRAMPKGSTLSDAQIKSIVCWIDSGSPNN